MVVAAVVVVVEEILDWVGPVWGWVWFRADLGEIHG